MCTELAFDDVYFFVPDVGVVLYVNQSFFYITEPDYGNNITVAFSLTAQVDGLGTVA